MSTRAAYWLCQILGWGVYAVGGFLIASYYVGVQAAIAIGFALFFCYSILFTHLLRALILRRQWLEMPTRQGMRRIFLSAAAAGLTQAALVISIATVFGGKDAFDAGSMAATAGGLVGADSMWVALYVGAHWSRRVREARLKEVQLQLTLRQAELRALHSQVNPHFLFNCLNTIRGMIAEDPARAQQMITSLASLFRRALQSSGEQMVPLQEEMEAVSDYLALESTRFEERLRVAVEIDAAAGRCCVPAMLVQGLVENAVKHGIAKLPAGGLVRVSGACENGALVVRVENSGTVTPLDPGGTHMGLVNARERLRLLYGERATLELSAANGTVTATAVIPRSA